VSLRVVHQEVQGDAEGSTVPVIALTHPTREKDVRAAVAAIDRLDTTRAGTRWMRIYGAE
jgi:hypothetical protein